MSENKFPKLTKFFLQSLNSGCSALVTFCNHKLFVPIVGGAIFLFSSYLRSVFDIGSDTAFYLDVAQKISHGGRYFYDFFESNFPLSFYFYVLQYKLSALSGINQILLSEIFVSALGLASIWWSARIMQRSTISDNKAVFNLIILSFFLGFFLRISAIRVMEFGTKTTLLLLLLYPYFSFSLARRSAFTTAELLQRGLLMGLIPCLKPHYLIFIIFFEAKNLYHRLRKTEISVFQTILNFVFELDKLLMALLGALYIFLMVKFTPEFFEFMIPMWLKFYPSYQTFSHFFKSALDLAGQRMIQFIFVLLVFARRKMDENDVTLFLFLFAAFVLMLMENIGSMDQMVVFYAALTACCFKVAHDLLSSNLLPFAKNKFIIAALMLLPVFEMNLLPDYIFYAGGFVNLWWVVVPIYPFFLAKELDKKESKKLFTPLKICAFVLFYVVALFTALATLRYANELVHIVVNLISLFAVLFFFERKINAKISTSFCTLSVFVMVTSFSLLTYRYISSITELLARECCYYTTPNRLSDQLAYHVKTFASKPSDKILMTSNRINHQFPFLNYFDKPNPQRPALNFFMDFRDAPSRFMFKSNDPGRLFLNFYFFEDFKNQMSDPNTKILIFNNMMEDVDKIFCRVNVLEYYLMDPEFRQIFFKNFRFENRVIISRKNDEDRGLVKNKKAEDAFDLLEPSPQKIIRDYEIYVRSDNRSITCEGLRAVFPNPFCQKKIVKNELSGNNKTE